MREERYAPALAIAEIYAHLGELDQAFSWLDIAIEQREPLLRALKHFDVYYGPLKGDHRYQDALKRIGLE